MTLPKRWKKVLKSVSVTLLGKPPRKTLGKLPLRFGFWSVRGLHGFGSICNRAQIYIYIIYVKISVKETEKDDGKKKRGCTGNSAFFFYKI